MKTLSLYIHIPFCIQKCLYCDFLSYEGLSDEAQAGFFDALVKEVAEAAGRLAVESSKTYEITSIYFGGGTPSFPEANHIERVMNAVYDYYDVNPAAEITLEVNPGTVNLEKFKAYKRMGINRLSIGAQSMSNVDLQHLGRAHTAAQFYEAYRDARTAGFRNISIDVMMGLPGQTLSDYLNTLREITECKPEHISSYSLIIEEGTPYFEFFGEGRCPMPDNPAGLFRLGLPDEDEERRMYAETERLLRTAGYHRYEISNFAKNDEHIPEKYESRHNKVYWTRGDYLGFGLGAASMINNKRFSNIRSFPDYCKAEGDIKKIRENITELDINSQIEEFMFLGLRLTEGVSTIKFENTFGVPFDDVYGEVVKALVNQGFIKKEKEYVSLTDRGIDLSNPVMAQFLFDR